MVDEGQARGYERGGIGGMEDSEGSELKRGRSVGGVGGVVRGGVEKILIVRNHCTSRGEVCFMKQRIPILTKLVHLLNQKYEEVFKRVYQSNQST